MDFVRSFLAISFTLIAVNSSAFSAPIVVKGATFDAPTHCELADGALVCKLDGQQFELWITRKPLAPTVSRGEPMARKMAYFTEIHELAVKSIFQSTDNDKATPFSGYGAFSALGSAMLGKGKPASPAVRFASVLHDEEIWEFLEVVAVRTPAIDVLSETLQRSLVLPGAAGATGATGAATRPNSSPSPSPSSSSTANADTSTDASTMNHPSFSGPLLSLRYPDFLEPVVIENTTTHFAVNFKHKTRASGPNLMVSLRPPKDKTETAINVVAARKAASTAMMVGASGSVEINALGEIKGTGFAMLGVPDAKKGLSGVESIETAFAADLPQGLLEVRLGSEQKNATETRDVWSLLAKSIAFVK